MYCWQARYFDGFRALIDRIQRLGVDVIATVHEEQRAAELPEGVVNLGMLSRRAYRDLLLQSKALIGFGDPVFGYGVFFRAM